MISQTNIDESFPVGNFLLPEYSVPYRLDCDSKGGGILLYVREDILWNLLVREKKGIGDFLCRVKFTQKQLASKLFLYSL